MDDELEQFGYKCTWLAVRDRAPEEVAAALGWTGGRPVTCGEAVETGYFDGRAILPTLPGVGAVWTLALLGETHDGDPVETGLTVSRGLGTQVQVFGSHRVAEWHLWADMHEGELVRCLEVTGETGELNRWVGQATPVEHELGLPQLVAPEDESAFDVVLAVGEESVMTVARAWSIDPSQIAGPAPGPSRVYPSDAPPLESATGQAQPARRSLWGRITGR